MKSPKLTKRDTTSSATRQRIVVPRASVLACWLVQSVVSSLDRPANLLDGGQRVVEPVAPDLKPGRAAVVMCTDAWQPCVCVSVCCVVRLTSSVRHRSTSIAAAAAAAVAAAPAASSTQLTDRRAAAFVGIASDQPGMLAVAYCECATASLHKTCFS